MSLRDSRGYREKLLEIHLRNLGTVLQQATVFGRESAPVHLLHRLEDELDSVLALSGALEVSHPFLVEAACRFLGRSASHPVIRSEAGGSPRQESSAGVFDAFLSHSSSDQTAVRELADRLRARGLRVWLDEEQIGPGDSITAKIDEGLSRSRYVLVCLSDHVKESNWCRAEYGALLHQEMHRRETRVIPVIVGDYDRETALPLLRDKLHIDLRNEAEFERLVHTLRVAD